MNCDLSEDFVDEKPQDVRISGQKITMQYSSLRMFVLLESFVIKGMNTLEDMNCKNDHELKKVYAFGFTFNGMGFSIFDK